jgi:hypothetical protein
MKRSLLTFLLPLLLLAAVAYRAAPTLSAQSGSNNRGKTSQNNRGKGTNNAQAPTMDCEQMAAASRGSMSVESCKQMMASMQAYQNATSDPSASQPGDDTMTCEQIMAEMKQQPITAPDQAKVAEAQQATAALQAKAAENQAEGNKLAAQQTAENVASHVADQFLPNSVQAARAAAQQKQQDALNEKIQKETAPIAERSTTATASLMTDMTQQLTANPRMAKLVQMASAKHCKQQ